MFVVTVAGIMLGRVVPPDISVLVVSKVPVLLICGSKEVKDKSVSIRKLGSEKQEVKKFDMVLKEFKSSNNLPIK